MTGRAVSFLYFIANPHHPFTPPGRYWDMYSPEDMTVPDNFRRHENPPPTLQWLRGELTHRLVNEMMRAAERSPWPKRVA